MLYNVLNRVEITVRYVVPWTRTKLGDRSFNVAVPRLWNKLPAELRLMGNFTSFRRQLKAHMFLFIWEWKTVLVCSAH